MKIAFITTFAILGLPPYEGGDVYSRRNLHLLQQAFGEENIYICAITKDKSLLSKAARNITVFYSDRSKLSILKNCLSNRLQFRKDVEDSVLEYIMRIGCDAVFLDSSRMGLLQERLPENIKQILYMVGIEKDYIKALMRINPSRVVLKRAFEINEALAVKNSDIVIVLNRRDADKLKEYYNYNPHMILPVTMGDSFIENKNVENILTPSTLQLLFVGSLFPPNKHGIIWFINEVMPHVNAELTVIGKNFEKLEDKLRRKNVDIIGSVDELSQFYNNADAVVSPVFLGEGMKVKTTGHMMYGKPMFATDESLEGYDVEGLKNIYRCNSKKDFIDAINAYANNPPYMRFDNEIRNLFLEKYHTPVYIPKLRDMLLDNFSQEM